MNKILTSKLKQTGSALNLKGRIGLRLSSTLIGLKPIKLFDLPRSFSWRFGPVVTDLSRYLSKYCHSHLRQFIEQPEEQMKLYTDKGNPFTIKVLAASFLSGQNVTVELVKRECFKKAAYLRKPKLPLLEIEPDKFLFSPNAMCCYLMEQCLADQNLKEKTQIDEMVEWDSSDLQVAVLPYLISHVVGGKCDTQLGNTVMRLLSNLNARLEKNVFVAGDVQSVADVVVWGTLYGVLEGKLTLTDLESKCPSVLKWFHLLSSQDPFATAVTKVTEGKGVQSFKESLQGIHLFPSVTKTTSDSSDGCTKVGATREEIQNDESNEGPSPNEILAAKKSWLNGRKETQKARKSEHPILPKPGEKNILVTSALPYVNNVPHLGNIIGCVLSADVYARYCRLRNYNILYICGTDEYGTATETKAIEEGITPQQICDKYNKKHTDVYNWFNIAFDYFGRTTTPEQTEIAQDIFWKLHKNNYLKEDTLEQLRCLQCSRFLADRFVEGTCPFCDHEDARGDQCDACGKLINAVELKSPRCKICGASPVIQSTNHIFLDLPKVEPLLRKWLSDTIDKEKWSNNAKQITKGWLQDGLHSRCITRDLKWGTPVPMEGYRDKVFYVWFDAPIGYLSITKKYTDQWEKWWKNPEQVTLVQFMAKDNVPFHTVVFPCSLLGADDNYTLLNDINATEYLNYEGDKFSKSRGVGVFGDEAEDTGIPADIYRFYLLFLRPENQDSAFSWAELVLRNNSELLNNFGNFINRALMFLKNSFNGTLPNVELQEDDFKFVALVNKELGHYIESLENIKLRDGLRYVLNISRIGNQYVQANQPWVLVKGNEQEKFRCGTIIGLACNLSALLSILVRPYMPKISDEIQDQLQFPAELQVIPDAFVTLLPAGHVIGKPNPLFQKLDNALAEQLKERFSGGQKPKTGGGDSAKGKENEIPVDVATIEAEVTKQGDAVRKAKTEKAAKEVIDAEVAKLLELKKHLAVAKGQNPNEAPQKGKSKDKKKGKKK